MEYHEVMNTEIL